MTDVILGTTYTRIGLASTESRSTRRGITISDIDLTVLPIIVPADTFTAFTEIVTINATTEIQTISGTTITPWAETASIVTGLDILPAYCTPVFDGLGDCEVSWGDSANDTDVCSPCANSSLLLLTNSKVRVYYWPDPESNFSCVVNSSANEIYSVLPSICPSKSNQTMVLSSSVPSAVANISEPIIAVSGTYTLSVPY